MLSPMPPLPHSGKRLRAFSLIELLVVISIIAIVLALAFPVINQIRHQAKSAGCVSHLRAIANAVMLYAADNNDYLPAGYVKIGDEAASTWFGRIAPYLPGTSGAKPTTDLPDVRYCPATSVRGDGIFKRDLATWRTDYAYNTGIFPGSSSHPITRRKKAAIATNKIMIYDGRQSGTVNSPNSHARHLDRINVLFFGGHVEKLETMPKDKELW